MKTINRDQPMPEGMPNPMEELEAKRAADRAAAQEAQAKRLEVLQSQASESGVVNMGNRYGEGTPAAAEEVPVAAQDSEADQSQAA
jgi:hypothetical protein